jgi:glycogen(starch) synthase
MKLLIYSHSFAPNIGGIETIVMSLARGLAELRGSDGQQQFEVTLATQTPARDCDDRDLPFSVARRPGVGRLWRLVRAADVIHLAGPAMLPLLLARLQGKPCVVEHHGFQTICPNGQLVIEPSNEPCPGHFMAGNHGACLRCQKGRGWPASIKLWVLTFVRRKLCRGASANLAPTRWLEGLLGLPKSVYVPHGLPSATAQAARERAAAAPMVIAFQGRLVSTKGTSLLLEAVEMLRRENHTFKVEIVGDGPERTALQKQVEEAKLGDRVQLLGSLPPPELEALLLRADVVVVPSLGGEVFGLVVAENMMRGKAVVASDVGALVEVLGDAGLTFRTGSSAALAQQLGKLLTDRGLGRRLGDLARQRVLHEYSRDLMIEAHVRVYDRLIAE